MTDIAPPSPAPVRIDSPAKRIAKQFVEDRIAVLGLVLFVVIALIAIAAPWIAPQNPYDLMQLSIMDGGLPPGEVSMATGQTFWLGTDQQGRDMLSGIMYGLRISLMVAVVSLTLAGYAFGNIKWVNDNLTAVIMGIIVLSLVPGILAWMQERYRSKRAVGPQG